MASIKPNNDNKAITRLLQSVDKIKLPPLKGRNNDEEDQILIAVMTYLTLQYKNLFAFHVANERKVKRIGKRKIPLEGIKLKKKGVKKGLPDVFILDAFTLAGVWYAGTVIELKRPGEINSTSVEQEKCLRDLNRRQYFTAVCDNFDDAKKIIDKNYG